MTNEKWATPAEAARILGVTRQTIYNRLSDGSLPSTVDDKGRRLIRIDDLAPPSPSCERLQYDIKDLLDAVLVDLGIDVVTHLQLASAALPDRPRALHHVALAACDLDTERHSSIIELMQKLQS